MSGEMAIAIIGVGLIGILLFLLGPIILMLCWNLVIPKLFNLPSIGIFEAIALVILSSILFGGIKAKLK